MKAADLIGRKIVRIDHDRVGCSEARRSFVAVSRIVLDNGVVLLPSALPTDDQPVGDLVRVNPRRKS